MLKNFRFVFTTAVNINSEFGAFHYRKPREQRESHDSHDRELLFWHIFFRYIYSISI